MTESHPEFTSADEQMIDLLVDGELNDERRRALLRKFDEQPSGWRRCALAFLEAQSWRGSLKTLAVERPAPVEAAEAIPVAAAQLATGKQPVWGGPLRVLAIAASMLVAFALGIVLRNGFAPQDVAAPGDSGFAQQDPLPTLPGNDRPGRDGRLETQPVTSRPSDNVRLVVDGPAGQPQTVDIPLVDDPALMERFPWENVSPVPQDIVRQLEQLGHRVEHQRRLAPVELQDGRRLLVPVEDVRIVPVKRQMY